MTHLSEQHRQPEIPTETQQQETPAQPDYWNLVDSLIQRHLPIGFSKGNIPESSSMLSFLCEHRVTTHAQIQELLAELQRADGDLRRRNVERRSDPYEDEMSIFFKEAFGVRMFQAIENVSTCLRQILKEKC